MTLAIVDVGGDTPNHAASEEFAFFFWRYSRRCSPPQQVLVIRAKLSRKICYDTDRILSTSQTQRTKSMKSPAARLMRLKKGHLASSTLHSSDALRFDLDVSFDRFDLQWKHINVSPQYLSASEGGSAKPNPAGNDSATHDSVTDTNNTNTNADTFSAVSVPPPSLVAWCDRYRVEQPVETRSLSESDDPSSATTSSSASPSTAVTAPMPSSDHPQYRALPFVNDCTLIESWRGIRYFRAHFSDSPDTVLLAGQSSGM